MSDLLRILVHLASLGISSYVLIGVDFNKFMRKGHSDKAQALFILSSLALAYLVAQFLLSISMNFVY